MPITITTGRNTNVKRNAVHPKTREKKEVPIRKNHLNQPLTKEQSVRQDNINIGNKYKKIEKNIHAKNPAAQRVLRGYSG
jgi:hypothetical protein